MEKTNPLRGEERRVVSTKLYRHEFVNFMKICETERKKVNAKLREMIQNEIENYPNKNIFTKKKEDQEKGEERLKQKYKLEIKRETKNV